jgi:hypothetical protein
MLFGAKRRADGTRLAEASLDGTVRIWDGRPVTPEVRVEHEALALVEYLFARPLCKNEVLAAIRDSKMIPAAVHQRALAFADLDEDQPGRLNDAAWAVVRWPGQQAEAYRLALQAAETACRPGPANGVYHTTLGVARYRVGRTQAALDTLAQAEKLNAARPRGPQPADLASLLMAHVQLGQEDKIQGYWHRLQQTVTQPPWHQDEAAQKLLAEAEMLVQQHQANPRP